jgi:hypothetical protein
LEGIFGKKNFPEEIRDGNYYFNKLRFEPQTFTLQLRVSRNIFKFVLQFLYFIPHHKIHALKLASAAPLFLLSFAHSLFFPSHTHITLISLKHKKGKHSTHTREIQQENCNKLAEYKEIGARGEDVEMCPT